MNWPRIILDGIAMSAVFNAAVLLGFTLWPQEYSVMFPKEIQKAAAPYPETEGCEGYHRFGLNRKGQLIRLAVFPFAAALLALLAMRIGGQI